MSSVAVKREGPIATVTLSNPSRFNAMTISMWRSLAGALHELDGDESVRVVVLQGDGERAFCAGADLSDADFGQGEAAARSEMNAAGEGAVAAIVESIKPVIAKIRGVCMGGGLELASACDLRICAADARLRMPAARLGLGYHFEGVQRYAALMGPMHTFDMFATARTFDGVEAFRLGFVSRVCEPGNLDAETAAYAELVAEQAPLTLRALKLSLRASNGEPSPPQREAIQTAVQVCLSSKDLQEGMAAFKEKRKPRFQGR